MAGKRVAGPSENRSRDTEARDGGVKGPVRYPPPGIIVNCGVSLTAANARLTLVNPWDQGSRRWSTLKLEDCGMAWVVVDVWGVSVGVRGCLDGDSVILSMSGRCDCRALGSIRPFLPCGPSGSGRCSRRSAARKASRTRGRLPSARRGSTSKGSKRGYRVI